MPLVGASSSLGYDKDSVRLPLTLTTDSANRTDAFVAKYTSSGQALWTARISGVSTTATIVYGTTTDSTGAVYATGQGACQGQAGRILTFYNADGSFGGQLSMSVNASTSLPFLVKYSASGIVQWSAYVTSSVSAQTIGYALTVDPSDGIYMTGNIGANSAVITAYNANGTAFGTTFTSAGATDAFLVKYNTSGTVQWLARVSSVGTDAGQGLAANSSGVYMTGQASGGTVTAYNANGTAFGTTFTSAGSTDAVIVRYNLTGTVQWLARVSTTAADVGYGAALDSGGNLLITGSIGAATATAYNSSGTAFATTLSSIGLGDSFVVKYNSTGSVQWVAKMGGTQTDFGYGIATDSTNSVYIAGSMGAATFTAFNSNNTAFGTTLTSRGNGDAFLVKYNSTGSVQWVAQIGGTSEDYGYSLVSDTSDNLYVLVYTNGTAPYTTVVRNSNGTTFSTPTLTTNQATCLVKYNSSGTAQWVVTLNSSTIPSTLCRDTSTNLVFGGQFVSYTSRNIGPSASVALTLSNAGSTDAMIVKYTTNGIPLWAARIASAGTDAAVAVVSDSSGNLYVTGGIAVTGAATAYNADGTAFGTTIPASRGFLVKYNVSGTVQWVASFTSGNTATTGGVGVVADSSGNVYVAVASSGSTSTVYSADATTLSTSSTGSGQAYVVKFNSSGIAQWIAYNSASTATMYGLAVDSSGNIIACGELTTATGATVGIYSAGGTRFSTFTSAGSTDGIVVKYNSSGIVQWVARAGSTTADSFRAVACDASGNVYVTGTGGSTTAAVTLYNSNGSGFATLPLTVGGTDGFVVKYDATGVGQWSAVFSSTNNDTPTALATDTSGNLYLTGYSGVAGSTSVVTFYNSDGTTSTSGVAKSAIVGFLVKYNTNGFVQWNIRLDGGGTSTGDYAYALALDRRGLVYTGGLLNTAGAAGIITDIAYVNYAPTSAFNLIKFTPYGLLQMHQAINGTTTYPITYGITTDFNCDVTVVGASANGQTTNIYAKG